MLKNLFKSKKVSPAAIMGIPLSDSADKRDIEIANKNACFMFWDRLQRNNERHVMGLTDGSYSDVVAAIRDGIGDNRMAILMPDSTMVSKMALYNHIKIVQQDLKLFKDFSDNGYIDFNNRDTMPPGDTIEQSRTYMQSTIRNLARRIGMVFSYRSDEMLHNVNRLIDDLQSNKNIDEHMKDLSGLEEFVKPSEQDFNRHKKFVNGIIQSIENNVTERNLAVLKRSDSTTLSGIYHNLVDLYTLQKTGDIPVNVTSATVKSTYPDGEIMEMISPEQRMMNLFSNLSSQLTSTYVNLGKIDVCILHPDDFSLTKEQINKTRELGKSLQPKERRLPELPDGEDELPMAQEYDIALG